jgi:hypothetical protein
VLPLPHAERLLRGAVARAALGDLSAALGFEPPQHLDRSTRALLQLPPEVSHASVARGRGALRALLIELGDGELTLELSARIARQIAHQSPEQLWFVATLNSSTPRLVLAAPPPDAGSVVPALDVDPRAPRASDIETFAALALARHELDLLAHLRWRETLGRDALTRRFYRELATAVGAMAETATGRANAEARRTIALLHASRFLFLAFLETRGWLDGQADFLRRQFADRCGGRGAHQRLLAPLFFGTLNTPWRSRAAAARSFGRVPFLNGGLFARSAIERAHPDVRMSEPAIEGLIAGVLPRYRLSPRENAAHWSDAAVDPEMLGRAFESLMHADERGARGTFYTPSRLIARLTRESLGALVRPSGVSPETLDRALAGDALEDDDDRRMIAGLRDVRLLDPTCGSGAFLVHALHALANCRRACGDVRPMAALRRETLTRSIFGVDVDPTAVWLCQLRLWLSVVVEEPIEDPLRLPPLPNLDRNVREGDALAGDGFGARPLPEDPAIASLRMRYVRANGARKHVLAKQLDRRERARAIAVAEQERIRVTAARRELLIAARSPALFAVRRGLARDERAAVSSLRDAGRRARQAVRALRDGAALPFSFATHFAEAAAAGGFDLILGNPPWVRPHAVSPEQRERLRARFVTMRDAAWRAGAEAAAAGAGFAAQADLAALFTERAVQLVRRGGIIGLVLPAKLWIALAGGGVRSFLAREAPPLRIEDLGDAATGFDAAVYPSLLVARCGGPIAHETALTVAAVRGEQLLVWEVAREELALDQSAGAPWLLLPREVRTSFDALARRGMPLAASRFGRALLGVKSGCNEAFTLTRAAADAGELPRDLLRPVLRGEDVAAWGRSEKRAPEWILWTHDTMGAPMATLPKPALKHLTPWRSRLEARSDARGDRWWSLFRTEAARCDTARVVWSDIGRSPRALVLEAGDPTIPLNTCYVVRAPSSDDAHALTALLNSSVAASWLGAIAEPARGGYRRFLGWTCARFPVPWAWDEARALLAPLARAAAAGEAPDAWTLTEEVIRAYALRHADLAPLLSWHAL